MQFTLNNSAETENINLDIKLELLVKALRDEPVEMVENQNIELEQEYHRLLRQNHIVSKSSPFNCQPYRDSYGRLNETKYIQLTSSGKKVLKNILLDLKENYKNYS